MDRSLPRRLADSAIALLKPHRWSHPAGALLVLTYHRVLPRNYSELDLVEPGMFVHDDTFAMHLRLLREEFEVVTLGEWLQSAANARTLPRRACAITFDDGWRDNYLHAYPLLKAGGVPATIFVVSDLVGTDAQFWPERLVRAVRHRLRRPDLRAPASCEAIAWLDGLQARGAPRGILGREEATGIIAAAKQCADDSIHARLDRVEQLEGSPARPMGRDLLDWQEIGEMVQSGLVSVGSHTRGHTRLVPGLGHDELHDEIAGSRRLIERSTSTLSEIFCYPNGDMCPEAESMVRANYRGACTTARGWNAASTDPHRLRRISVHEDRSRTEMAFTSAISGWY